MSITHIGIDRAKSADFSAAGFVFIDIVITQGDIGRIVVFSSIIDSYGELFFVGAAVVVVGLDADAVTILSFIIENFRRLQAIVDYGKRVIIRIAVAGY